MATSASVALNVAKSRYFHSMRATRFIDPIFDRIVRKHH
jgi:hypothetical protein